MPLSRYFSLSANFLRAGVSARPLAVRRTLKALWRRADRLSGNLPFKGRIRTKNFSGSLWDRLHGLEYIFEKCQDCSVLDIASCEGLISYECARHGANLVHGLECDRDRVLFSRRLFRDVPVTSRFETANLAVPVTRFLHRFGNMLLPRYDIVLFLGIYHHLAKQMSSEDLAALVEELIQRADRYFVVRSNRCSEIEPLILSRGFSVASLPDKGRNGKLRIYARHESQA